MSSGFFKLNPSVAFCIQECSTACALNARMLRSSPAHSGNTYSTLQLKRPDLGPKQVVAMHLPYVLLADAALRA